MDRRTADEPEKVDRGGNGGVGSAPSQATTKICTAG
jgi:hypothetical protein